MTDTKQAIGTQPVPTEWWAPTATDAMHAHFEGIYNGLDLSDRTSIIEGILRLAAAPKAEPAPAPAGEYPPLPKPALPKITAEDRSFLHYNPNTDDIVEWVQHYASAAITADRAMRAQAAPAAVAGPMQLGGCPECGSRSCVARQCSLVHARPQEAPVAQGDAWRDLCWQIADALECTPCTADEVLPKVLTIAEEAARYRWLRRWKGQEHEPPFTVQHEMDGTMWGDDLDAAIDAARAQAKEGASHG